MPDRSSASLSYFCTCIFCGLPICTCISKYSCTVAIASECIFICYVICIYVSLICICNLVNIKVQMIP